MAEPGRTYEDIMQPEWDDRSWATQREAELSAKGFVVDFDVDESLPADHPSRCWGLVLHITEYLEILKITDEQSKQDWLIKNVGLSAAREPNQQFESEEVLSHKDLMNNPRTRRGNTRRQAIEASTQLGIELNTQLSRP